MTNELVETRVQRDEWKAIAESRNTELTQLRAQSLANFNEAVKNREEAVQLRGNLTLAAAGLASATQENATLRLALNQMKEAIYWALGERGEFPDEPEPLGGKYRRRFWWRPELRRRSCLPVNGRPDAVAHAVEPRVVDPNGPPRELLPLLREAVKALDAGVPIQPTSFVHEELTRLLPKASAVKSPHTAEDDFQHYLSYSGKRGVPHEADLRLAYYAGADVQRTDEQHHD